MRDAQHDGRGRRAERLYQRMETHIRSLRSRAEGSPEGRAWLVDNNPLLEDLLRAAALVAYPEYDGPRRAGPGSVAGA